MNPEQQSAAHADLNYPLCVVAGPGSGKTYTLIERIKYVARTDVHASILVLAFSKTAVTEMQARLAKEGCEMSRINVATFHSFGFKIVTTFHKQMGFERLPSKMSSKQSNDILKESLDVAPDMLLAYNASENKVAFLRKLLKVIQFANCKSNPSSYLAQNASHDLQECRQIANIFQAYQQKLKSRALFDFPDMVNLPQSLFAQCLARQATSCGSDALSFIQEQYKYIVVDEFQDLNGAQLQLLLQVGVHGHVTVVGDFDQMIYSFQGAERSNFQRFRQYFEQHGLTAKLLQLRVNYRSVGAIVEASNLVANQRGDNAVGATSTHLQKQMVSGLEDHNEEHVTGAAIRVVECSSDPNAIFTYVGAQITRILQEAQRSGINNTGNIAVLYRQNATGKELKKYLKDHFPHIQTKQHKSDTADVTGVDTRNQLKRVTRLVIAWLRTAVDPSENSSCAVCLDDIELSSSRSAKRVTSNGEMSVLQRAQDLLSTGRARSLFEAACIVVRTNESLIQSPVGKKRKATGKGNNAFIQSAANKLHKLESLHDRIAANEETLPRILEKSLDDLGLMKKERSDHARKEANRKQLHQEQQLRQSFATIHSSSSVPNATKGNYTQTAPPLSDDELDEDKANLMQFFTTLQAEANKLHRDSVFRALSNKQQLDIFVQIIEASHLTTSGHGNASTTTSIEECKDSSVVWLGTIHGAKGREWSRVYLVDADDNTYSDFRHNQVQDMSDIDSDDGGANEDTLLEPTENGPTDDSKNLIYVAVSRAKHSLTVLYRNGGSGQARQSTSDCRELSRYLRPIMTLAASGGVEYENLNSKPIKLSGVVQVSSTLQSNAGVYSGVSDVNYSGSKTTSGVEFLRASAYSQAPKTNAPVMPPYSVQPVAFNPVVPQPSSSLSVPRISTTSSTSFTSSHVQRQISSQMPKQIPSQIPPTISHTDEKENAANSQKSSTSSSSTSSSTTNTKVRFPPSSQLLANLKKSTTSSSVSRSVGTESGTAISTGSQKKANGSNFVDLT